MDLLGRLSNPPYNFGQMVRALPKVLARASRESKGAPAALQIQHRIDAAELAELLDAYVRGGSVADLVGRHGLSRTTILSHLKRAGIEARVNKRKLTDQQVEAAGDHYRDGESLASIAKRFEVDPSTIRRELRKAGVAIRPRPGWTPATSASSA